MRRPKPPKTKARLEQLITQWQKDSGVPVARLNLRIAAMMLAGALARVVDPDGEAVFATKGGIAMELWMGGRARATRDIDVVLRGDPERLAEQLDAGLREPYNGFTFRRGEIDELPARPSVKKVTVQVSFAGRILSSPQLEIASVDTGHEEFIAIPATKLDAVGLDGPDVVLVLAERWQIAQKLHAVTEQPTDGRENPRFRDLIDLQLLEALDPDLSSVRDKPPAPCVPISDASRPLDPSQRLGRSWSDRSRASLAQCERIATRLHAEHAPVTASCRASTSATAARPPTAYGRPEGTGRASRAGSSSTRSRGPRPSSASARRRSRSPGCAAGPRSARRSSAPGPSSCCASTPAAQLAAQLASSAR
ncbi:MAG TPA: nucleotidyl transferase AbiEii/AbiGii toxin family protein [Solirubrobacteraceae bacterium]|nr:nucleotidyl transferase AbiEii/AbiGii toxin family protein [Solirubrobacteraceae bacterium]